MSYMKGKVVVKAGKGTRHSSGWLSKEVLGELKSQDPNEWIARVSKAW